MVVKINENYLKLKSSYLFVEVARREAEFQKIILMRILLKWVLEMLPNR